MKPGLEGFGIVRLARGQPLRVPDPAGRYLTTLGGVVWVTQEGDRRDRVLAEGEDFRFDRDGLALVTPLGGPAQVALDDRRDAAPVRSIAESAVAWLAGLTRAPGRMLRRRRTVRELQSLSDHMLRDVGLRRDEIECVARRLVESQWLCARVR